MKKLGKIAFCLMCAYAGTAHAHIRVISHVSRHTASDQKVGPCGRANSRRGTQVYTYAPGETIAVTIDEYITHPGWFRISFDDDGDDSFVPPTSISPPAYYANETVLMDDLDSHTVLDGGGQHTWEVTLPDIECDNCTLQIIQVMLDKLPYDPNDSGAFSNDIYYACIDLELKRPDSAIGSGGSADSAIGSGGSTAAPPVSNSTPPLGGGCASGCFGQTCAATNRGDASDGGLLPPLLAVAWLLRRAGRRRRPAAAR